jgi:hypothetical protein
MGYGIRDFYTTATKYGLARNNMFRVKSISNNIFQPGTDELLVFAKSGSIPSRVINTAKVSFKSFDFVVPMNASYPENQGWSIEFYCDNSYIIRSMLEQWSKGTFNEHGHFRDMQWHNCDIELVLLDVSSDIGDPYDPDPINSGEDRETMSYTLRGCFPLNIGAMSYNSTGSGEVVSMQTTLAFQYVESNNNAAPVSDIRVFGSGNNILNKIENTIIKQLVKKIGGINVRL